MNRSSRSCDLTTTTVFDLFEEEDAFLVSIELFPSDAKGYADRMKPFLEQYDGFVRWDIVESADRTVMAFLRVSFDVDLAKDEIEVGLEELKDIISEFFEEETDSFENSECTLNFMWLYQ